LLTETSANSTMSTWVLMILRQNNYDGTAGR
jgi:hypothetical protein